MESKESLKNYAMKFKYAVCLITKEKDYSKAKTMIEPVFYTELEKKPLEVDLEEIKDKLEIDGCKKVYYVKFEDTKEVKGKLKKKKLEDFDFVGCDCVCTHEIQRLFVFKHKKRYFIVGSVCQKQYINYDKEKIKKLEKKWKKEQKEKAKLKEIKLLKEQKEQKEKEEKEEKEKQIKQQQEKNNDLFDDLLLEDYNSKVLEKAKKTFIKSGKHIGKSWFDIYNNNFNVIRAIVKAGNPTSFIKDLYDIKKLNAPKDI